MARVSLLTKRQVDNFNKCRKVYRVKRGPKKDDEKAWMALNPSQELADEIERYILAMNRNRDNLARKNELLPRYEQVFIESLPWFCRFISKGYYENDNFPSESHAEPKKPTEPNMCITCGEVETKPNHVCNSCHQKSLSELTADQPESKPITKSNSRIMLGLREALK